MEQVFPAPAGINRRQGTTGLIRARVPRASGDKPPLAMVKRQPTECSPRQRG
ncbi:hypothetical protein I6S49_002106 [Salmonella enterica subsp. enterica serovar Paratyphi B]|nr:hypothetical protein [Salmonella enterica subsp. enterica serovar Paratyphi B]